MNIVSIDLELNKPTNSIISLGYVIANVKTKKIVVAKNLYVRPLHLDNGWMTTEQIDSRITQLTGITQAQVNNGQFLGGAYLEFCKDLNQHQVNKHPLQWGLDHYELRNQMKIEWKDFVFRARGHDIKSLFQLYQMAQPNGQTVAGLERAIKLLGLTWDNAHGPPHNSLADAYNTLLLYFHIADKLRKIDAIMKITGGN